MLFYFIIQYFANEGKTAQVTKQCVFDLKSPISLKFDVGF